MARKQSMHQLEKWARLATEHVGTLGLNKAEVFMEEVTATDGSGKARNTQAYVFALTQFTFTVDLLEGCAQVVRMSDYLYEDVIETDEVDTVADIRMPWDSFAIEVKGHDSQQAIAVVSIGHMIERVDTVIRVLKLSERYGTALMAIAKFLDKYDKSKYLVVSIPSLATCERFGKGLRDSFVEAGAKGFPKSIGAFPYPIHCAQVDFDMVPEEVGNKLVAFVAAENMERTPVYVPPRNVRPNPKKRRCNVTIYEMGMAWSKAYQAYRAYRDAVKSGSNGGHMRPHIRRAHFHKFRVGPRDGEPQYVTHWLAPMLIGDAEKYQQVNQGHIYG